MKALVVSILFQNPKPSGPDIYSTQTYYAAIRALRKGFTMADQPCNAEFAASIMCLSLAEVCYASLL